MSATLQAAVPTARSMAWTPIALTVTGLLVVAALVRVSGREAPAVLTLGAGAVAGLTVLALRDPAAALLAAVPLTAWRRRLLRLGWTAVVALPLWFGVTALLPGPAAGWPALAALVTSALAVAVWLPSGSDPGRAAAVPMLWAASGALLGGLDGPLGRATTLWNEHPWPVVATAAVLLVTGRAR